MEGRELRRSYTQFDFSTNRHHNHQQANRARQQNGTNGPVAQSIAANKHLKNKTPSIEIYRPPGQRSELDQPSKQLNVHAKEFVMSSTNALQTSRSTGNILLSQNSSGLSNSNHANNNQQQATNSGVTHHSILLPSSIKHSPSNKNVRWEDGKNRSSVAGGLVRSKSMVSSQSRGQESRMSAGGVAETANSKDSVITPLGPLSRTQYANIKHAIDGTGKLNSEETMSVVKVLIDRAMESRNYANVIATACDKIIDRESSQMSGGSIFLESLINYAQYSLNKLKENSVNRKFNGIMAFVCELYIMLKSKTLLRDAKWGLVSPSQWLLKLLAKCCHEVLQDPHLHMKPDQVESLFLTMTMVGRDLEKELPQNMDSLMSSIRDSFLTNARLSQTIKHTLLQIIEIHAACWQLPAFTLMYYKGSPHLVSAS